MRTANPEAPPTAVRVAGEGLGPWHRWLQPPRGRILICAILALGIAARLSLFLHNRSLWLDEAALAVNVIDKSVGELLGPLDHHQNSPLAFLLSVKLLVGMLGPSEYALRLLPLLSGIASLFLMWAAAMHLPAAKNPGGGASSSVVPLLAIAFLAAAQYPIYYASEFRHYSTDIAVTCLLLLLAFRECAHRDGSADSALAGPALVLVGVAAVWFSLASVYVLAAIGTTQLLFGLYRGDWRRVAWAVTGGALWLGSFAAHAYIHESNVALRNLGPEIDQVHARWCLPSSAMSREGLRWFPKVLLRMFRHPASLDSAGLSAFAALLGCLAFWRNRKERLCILLLPCVYTLIGSASGRYPVYERYLLFLVPCIYLLLAEGLGGLLSGKESRARSAGALLVFVLLAHPMAHAAKVVARPYDRCEARPLMAHIEANWQEGDAVYVECDMAGPFLYYCRQFGIDKDVAFLEPPEPSMAGKAKAYRNENIAKVVSRAARTWVLFDNGERPIVGPHGQVNRLGEQLDVVASHGATLFLYGPSEETPTPRTWPSDPVMTVHEPD